MGSENDDRRQRANYAWQHPRKGTSAGETAAGAAWARSDPFASRRGTGAAGQAADHFDVYAQRAKWGREREAAAAAAAANRAGRVGEGDGHYRAGTSVFGAAKAEEESRLINDSSATRSGQVRLPPPVPFVSPRSFSPSRFGAGRTDVRVRLHPRDAFRTEKGRQATRLIERSTGIEHRADTYSLVHTLSISYPRQQRNAPRKKLDPSSTFSSFLQLLASPRTFESGAEEGKRHRATLTMRKEVRKKLQ